MALQGIRNRVAAFSPFSALPAKAHARRNLMRASFGDESLRSFSSTFAMPASLLWSKIAWSPTLGLFVAVAAQASASNIAVSRDGFSWSTVTSPDATSLWRHVCWSSELRQFVAVASAGTARCATSSDGVNWVVRTMPTASQWYGVLWCKEKRMYVATHASGGTDGVATSPDGVTWTSRVTPNAFWVKAVWSPELNLFVATSSTVSMTSPDGVNWTSRTNATSTDFWGVAWSPVAKVFVQAGYQNISGSSIQYSTDGVSWQLGKNATGTANIADAVIDVIWIPEHSVFVAGGHNTAQHLFSYNGRNWKPLSASVSASHHLCWSRETGRLLASCGTSSVMEAYRF